MAVLMEDTSLDAERFLVKQWSQAKPERVRSQLIVAWKCGCQMAGREIPLLDPFVITQKVLDGLSFSGVSYLVGGSVASSLYGEPRYSDDTDLEIWANQEQLARLRSSLAGEFISTGRGLTHRDSQYKIDLFVSQNRPFDLARAKRRQIPEGFAPNFWVSSPEDMVLTKLEWYRSGRQLSDRQWRDVLAILAVQGSRLSLQYLQYWAGELGVADLLELALEQVKPLQG